jgi:DNA-binding transcriptional regulator YiaG
MIKKHDVLASIRGSARMLGVSERQARRWAMGTSKVSPPVAILLRLMIRLGLTPEDLKE